MRKGDTMRDNFGSNKYASYNDAAFVAMELTEGLEPKAFFDVIPSKRGDTQMVNYKGMTLLSGIMGCRITNIEETDESDDEIVVMKIEAENPAGDKGYAWLSRPKKSKQGEDEDDFREKIYTHGKRNALRDLVPYQVFLELLLKRAAGGEIPKPKPKPKHVEVDPVDVAYQKALALARKPETRDRLKSLEITFNECVESAETKSGKKKPDFGVDEWILLMDILDEPMDYIGDIELEGEPVVEEVEELDDIDVEESSEEESEEVKEDESTQQELDLLLGEL